MHSHCKDCNAKLLKTTEKLVWSGTKNRRKIRAPKCKSCFSKDVLTRRKRKYGLQANKIIHLKTRYGLTLEEYEAFCDLRNNQCELCGSTRLLHIDHDHKTGELRGLLCNKCNQGLGLFNDSSDLIQKAYEYLKK